MGKEYKYYDYYQFILFHKNNVLVESVVYRTKRLDKLGINEKLYPINNHYAIPIEDKHKLEDILNYLNYVSYCKKYRKIIDDIY